MAENLITNANDVEVLFDGTNKTGSSNSMSRAVVDEFSITTESDDSLVSGVGRRTPHGVTNGDITFSFSFTMQGSDVSTFETVAKKDGRNRFFDMTASYTDDGGTKRWEFALKDCRATSEELSGSSGDATEYAVEGIAVSVSKEGEKGDGSAWETGN